MRFSGQILAYVGVVYTFGLMLPAAEALAFGQQWRPAPEFLPAQAPVYGPGANMPGFRPPVAARSGYGQPFDRLQQQRPYPQRFQQRPFQPRGAYAQARRTPAFGPSYASNYYPPQPGFAPPGYGYQRSAPPSAGQTWMPQRRQPMFTQQYRWRPAGQPWVAQRARPELPQQPRYQAGVGMPGQMVGFRPTGAGYPVPAGSWRPAVRPAQSVHPQYTYQRYGQQAPGYAANLQPMFRSARPPVWPMHDARMAGMNPVSAGQPYWRPAPADAAAWHPDMSFRPAAYGRRLAGGAASPDREGSDLARDNLPGWATTHQEMEESGSCGWCSGS